MDVASVQNSVNAALIQHQSQEATLVQKVLRNPTNATAADWKAARAAARDGDADDAAQQAALAAVTGKGAKVNTSA